MEKSNNGFFLSPTKSKINKNTSSAPEVASASQRLQQELFRLMMNKMSTITAFPEGENLLKWVATIEGPPDTPYEGLKYKLSMNFPDKYPYNPPVIKFVTPCFHPNVDNKGNICLDILKEEWSALYDIRAVLISIQSLLGEPNIDSPLNKEAAILWGCQPEYRKVLHEKYEKQSRSTL